MCDVSIIMPVKNESKYLIACIDSIMAQTHHSWELIVVDDHSEDETRDLIRKFDDPRIRLFSNSGTGIIEALQTGLSHCSGRYISRMDGDDVMPQDRLIDMIRKSNEVHQKSIVTGKVRYFGDEISKGYLDYQSWLNNNLLSDNPWSGIYRECVIASPNWMVDREAFEGIGGFSGLSYPEDYDLAFRWYANDFTIQALDQVTLFWREHADRISRKSTNYNQQSFFELKLKWFLQLEFNHQPLIIWGHNPKSKLTWNYLRQKGVDFVALTRPDPKEIISSFSDYPTSQILVCVYPEVPERLEIESFLKKYNKLEGSDWWYL